MVAKYTICVYALVLLLLVSLSHGADLLIDTTHGPVQGHRDEKTFVSVWVDIPYAAPPVDNLRFKAPEDPVPWTTPVDNSLPSKPCPQWLSTSLNVLLGQEDCLYLTVYAPKEITKPLPVLFWIYGGGWGFGDSLEFGLYNGINLVNSNQDFIIVSPNYRLGPLGFLSMQELEDERGNGSVGNTALLDQRKALQWVHNNIAKFGGDPKNITIWGESAGCFSVNFHLASPASQNLFDKAICDSASASSTFIYISREEQEAWASEWAIAMGCTDKSTRLECLRKADFKDLVRDIPRPLPSNYNHEYNSIKNSITTVNDTLQDTLSSQVLERIYGNSATDLLNKHPSQLHHSFTQYQYEDKRNVYITYDNNTNTFILNKYSVPIDTFTNTSTTHMPKLYPTMGWVSTIDNSPLGLSDTPYKVLLKKPYPRPFITGANKDEGTWFFSMMSGLIPSIDTDNFTEDSLKTMIANFFPESLDVILSIYPPSSGTPQLRSEAIIADFLFKCPARRLARIMGKDSWLYHFVYLSQTDPVGKTKGVYHMAELYFAWQNPFIPFRKWDEQDIRMVDIMNAYWHNFITLGSPNNPLIPPVFGQIDWPSVTSKQTHRIELSPKPWIFTENVNLNNNIEDLIFDKAICDVWDKVGI